MAASPFETPPCRRLLRVRPRGEIADFLILRASALRQGDLILRRLRGSRLEGEVALLRVRASVSKDEEIRHETHAIARRSAEGDAAVLWRRIVRVAGYILAALALVALGGDILGWVRGDGFEFTIIGRHWYALDAGSLNLSQAVVQRYVHPWLWDPAIVAVLNVPTAPLFAALGIALLVLGRAPQKRRRVFY